MKITNPQEEKKNHKHYKMGVHYDIKSMMVSFGLTIYLGQYETARIDRAFQIKSKLHEFPEENNEEAAMEMLRQIGAKVKKHVIEEAKKVYHMEIIHEKIKDGE